MGSSLAFFRAVPFSYFSLPRVTRGGWVFACPSTSHFGGIFAHPTLEESLNNLFSTLKPFAAHRSARAKAGSRLRPL
jgi:hypothetical protein